MELIRKFYAADPKDAAQSSKTIVDSFEKAGLDADKLVETVSILKSAFDGLGVSISEQLIKGLKNANNETKELAKTTRSQLKSALSSLSKDSREYLENSQKLKIGQLASKDVLKQIQQVEINRKRVAVELATAAKEGLITASEAKKLLIKTNEAAEEYTDELKSQLSQAQKIEKSLGKMGDLMKGLTKIPIVGSFIDSEKVLERMQQTAADGGSKWKVFGAGIKESFSSIGESLKDPIVQIGLIASAIAGIFSLFQKIVKMVVAFEAKTFDIAKDLGISVDEAKKLQDQFIQVANTSANAGLTAGQLVKSYAELSNTMGFLVPQNRDFAEIATLIQKRTGASAEDMSVLARQSALTGTSLEQTYGTIEASRQVEGARNKLSLSTKQIMDGIAKTSSTIVINFKGSTKALSDAVIRATKLGTTLDQINKQAESLIDFESSIQKEFELQVLTGRDINLTRARELALAGDTQGLMEELNHQQITYDSFMKENIISRKAEAEAVGLSVEELSKQLLAQKQANALGAEQGQSLQDRYNQLVKGGATQAEIIDKLGSKQAAEDLRKASMQDRFQAAIERLQDTLSSILEGPVKGLIDGFITFIGKTENVTKIANTLKSIFNGIAGIIQDFPGFLSKAVPILKLIAASMVAIMSASIIASLSAIPVVGPALGLAAATAAAAAITAIITVPTPTFGSSPGGSMTQPVSPVTSMTRENVDATGISNKTPIIIHNHVKVGDEPWGKVTTKAMNEYHGKSVK